MQHTTPSHAPFSESEAALKVIIQIHRHVRKGTQVFCLVSVRIDVQNNYCMVRFCPVERYDYRMRTTRSTCLNTIAVIDDTGVKPVRQSHIQLSHHQTFISYKKPQVRFFAHTSLRSRLTKAYYKRGNKNHMPNNLQIGKSIP